MGPHHTRGWALSACSWCRPAVLCFSSDTGAGSKKTGRLRAHPGAATASAGLAGQGWSGPRGQHGPRLGSLTRAGVRSRRLRKFCHRTCRLFSWGPPETWICCKAVCQVRGLPAGSLTRKLLLRCLQDEGVVSYLHVARWAPQP